MPRELVFVHVAANLVWIGSMAAVGWVLGLGLCSPKERGAIARSLYLALATPSFLVSLLSGLVLLGRSLSFYFVDTQFMHAKLLFAFGAIAIHHVLGASARSMARGRRENPPRSWLVFAFVACAAAAAYFAVLKPL